MQGKMAQAIEYLAAKYETATVQRVTVEDEGNVVVVSDKGHFTFITRFGRGSVDLQARDVPMFHWRVERRYQEMRKVWQEGHVGDPVGMRIKHIAGLGTDFTDLLVREIDLAQWLLDQRIDQVFATLRDGTYANVILSTDRGIKISAEIGIAKIREPVLFHEIIAKEGVITDTPVDTQILHYSTYVYRGEKITTYTDVDFELYGLNYIEIARARFIVSVLSDPTRIKELQDAYRSTTAVISAIRQSAVSRRNLSVDIRSYRTAVGDETAM